MLTDVLELGLTNLFCIFQAYYSLCALKPLLVRVLSLVGRKLVPGRNLWFREDNEKSKIYNRRIVKDISFGVNGCSVVTSSQKTFPINWTVGSGEFIRFIPSFESIVGNTTHDEAMIRAIHAIGSDALEAGDVILQSNGGINATSASV